MQPLCFGTGSGDSKRGRKKSVWGMGRMEVILWHRVIPHTMENTTFRSGTATRFVSIIPHLVQECQPPRTALGGISVGGGGDRFAEHKTPPRFTEEEHRYAVRSYPIAVGVVKYPPLCVEKSAGR